MKLKRLFFPIFCFAFALCLSIGSGFSAFFFGDGASLDGDQNVDVRVEPHLELGTVTLSRDDLGYQVFFGTDQVYIIGNDDPTHEAEFSVKCDVSSSLTIPVDRKLALACDIIIRDPDARGVKIAEGGEYFYSDSMLDYIAPVRVLSDVRDGVGFAVLAETDQSITYRCVLAEDISASQSEPFVLSGITLKFKYADYEMSDGTHVFSGSMMPSSQYRSPETYVKVMSAAKAAYADAEITVVFRLILTEVG